MAQSQLTEMIRKKYPGQYDDMDDVSLEKAILTKYPDYKDLAVPLTTPKVETPIVPEVQKQANIPAPPSRMEQLYRMVFDAPEFITKPARAISDYVTEPSNEDDSYLGGVKARAKGFLGGAIEGAANLLSPANIVQTAFPESRVLNLGLGAAMGAHGAHELSQGNVAEGVGDIGFGLLGAAPHMGGMPDIGRTPREMPISRPLPPDSINQAAILDAIKKPIVEHERPEGIWDQNPDLVAKPATLNDDVLFDLAREKHGMAQDLPPELANENVIPELASKPTAEFIGHQPTGIGDETTPLFNISGGPKDRSTVTLETLKELGIDVPEVPTQQPKLNGDQIRALAIKKAQQNMDAKNKGFRGTVPDEPVGDGGSIVPPTDVPVSGGSDGPPPVDPKIEPLIIKLSERKPQQASALNEAWNLSRGLMSVDLPFITSAAFRQGLPLIGTKNWIKAWGPSIKSYGSKTFYDSHLEMLKNDPLMTRGKEPVMDITGEQMMKKGRPVFKETPSVGEQAGLQLTDLDSLSSREESIRSQLAERIPVWGKVVAASNRAYTAYINDLRMNAFRNMYEAMPDPNNMPALKELGEAVNVFTGRGALKGNIAGQQINLEKYAQALSNGLFAPKLIMARMKMLNPQMYMSGSPQARKEYLKAGLRTAGAWSTFAGLGSMMGAQVSMDPTSSDFGKIKIGNTRLDPAGGFQQFVVLASRLAQQESTSSTTGKTTPFNSTPFSSSTGKALQDFVSNKLHPNLKKLYDAAFANKSRPYHVVDRELQSWIPMITQDLIDIAKEQPELVPALAPLVSAGMGLQNYEGKDFNKSQIVPEQYDMTIGR